jgi:GntR family transcriptional regulator, transcriptional repressor for pyruvate dehydrogenase complex
MARSRASLSAVDRDSAPPGLPIGFSLLSSDDRLLVDPRIADVEARPLKISEVVAQRVVADIVSAQLQIGDRLPGESEMLEQYDVSRESLREGLRLLETQGFLTIRRGPGGGPIVGAVDPRNLARMSTLYFHLAGANYEELFDTWLLLEPPVVRQVAERVDRATKRKVLEPFLPDAVVADREQFMSTSNGFHAVLANLSGNKVLTLLLQAISHIVVDHVIRDLDPLNEREEIGQDHANIGQAVLDGKGATAQRLAAEHIGHIVDDYRTHFPDAVQELIAWR